MKIHIKKRTARSELKTWNWSTQKHVEDQEYDGLRISGDLDGEHMNVRQMMFIRGNYMLTIVVMAPEETMVEDVLGRFYHLQDSEE